ncbi:cyclic nucleotide-binding domain-containing protein [bacterium]|nr:cyclic nucleotide-binding domain-containing protein [bacterium]MBU1883707.1 cyclic nucleotide-binding domain-containing protein [bacterium]
MDKILSLSIMQNMIDSEDDFILLFEDTKIILANRSFFKFFGETSVEDFNASFEDFTDCFIPHPHYFNKTKIPEGMTWMDAISKLDEKDKIVSLITTNFEPHAFLVTITKHNEQYTGVRFIDITNALIKKIMIDNAHIPLLSHLEFGDVANIIQLLHLKHYKKDDVIVHEGSQGDSMFFIVDGNVLVHNKNIHVQLKEGDFFGEIALLKNTPRTATVTALKDCKVFKLTADDFQNIIKTKPDLLKEIEKVASSRL